MKTFLVIVATLPIFFSCNSGDTGQPIPVTPLPDTDVSFDPPVLSPEKPFKRLIGEYESSNQDIKTSDLVANIREGSCYKPSSDSLGFNSGYFLVGFQKSMTSKVVEGIELNPVKDIILLLHHPLDLSIVFDGADHLSFEEAQRRELYKGITGNFRKTNLKKQTKYTVRPRVDKKMLEVFMDGKYSLSIRKRDYKTYYLVKVKDKNIFEVCLFEKSYQ